ncbi:hypothetical protein I7I53_08473 [Histoplasma capsulatum var. duboisii H88]|uniref:Uncharacterized protein n=1 Tax=Ajellomyces capsulatus (strain H88) TaxID=544711 RepID=A0A8A1LJW7_AJEC8|nr:hypothetical protein I7I53_08473 [Histoplasma capsulatum var. duboisii H88]
MHCTFFFFLRAPSLARKIARPAEQKNRWCQLGFEGAAGLLNLQLLRDWRAQRSSWVRSFHRVGFTESGF